MERYEVDDGIRELARHAGGENDAQLAYNPVASCRRRLQIMKRHWVWAVALSLAAVGAPPASTAAGDEHTSGGGETRSSYEQGLRRVEAAFGYYREALAIEPRYLVANEGLGAMRTLDRLKKSLASVT